MAGLSDFLSYRVQVLSREERPGCHSLELGSDIPFSPLKHRPFVPLLSHVAYLSPLRNGAN